MRLRCGPPGENLVPPELVYPIRSCESGPIRVRVGSVDLTWVSKTVGAKGDVAWGMRPALGATQGWLHLEEGHLLEPISYLERLRDSLVVGKSELLDVGRHRGEERSHVRRLRQQQLPRGTRTTTVSSRPTHSTKSGE